MTKQQCVTSGARKAIGLNPSLANDTTLAVGSPADLVVFRNKSTTSSGSFRARKTTQAVVNDAGQERTTIFQGKVVSQQSQQCQQCQQCQQ